MSRSPRSPVDPPRPSGRSPERDRKAEHLRLAQDDRMQVDRHYFDDYAFEHRALPEIDLAAVDTTATFLGKRLSAPLLISCMTGGIEEAGRINRNLARAAEEAAIAVGVGSQRPGLEDDAAAESFRIRPQAPTVPVLANLGAVQLNHGYGLDECRRAVAMVEADALVLHLNPLQEAIQPEGETDFSGLLDKMGAIARELEVPVVAKEIGSGISVDVARELLRREIRIIDAAGVGGTSWARIEAARADDPDIGEVFADWGIPTPDLIRRLREVAGLTVIGSGGVRHGLDVARAVALGADLAGMAYPFLLAAAESAEAVLEKIGRTIRELRIAMFCVGARTLDELRRIPLERRDQRTAAGERPA